VTDATIDCAAARAWLALPPDHPAERAALDAHLQSCPACTAYRARQVALDARLRSGLLVDPPAEVSARLIALARAAATPPQRRSWISALQLRAAAVARGLVPRSSPGSHGADPRATPQPGSGPARPLERAAAYALAAFVIIWLHNALDLQPWLSAVRIIPDLAASVGPILASTAWLVLPAPADAISWLAPALGLLAVAWLLRGERPDRPSDARGRPS
jgi:anti-sigma factor RsiW